MNICHQTQLHCALLLVHAFSGVNDTMLCVYISIFSALCVKKNKKLGPKIGEAQLYRAVCTSLGPALAGSTPRLHSIPQLFRLSSSLRVLQNITIFYLFSIKFRILRKK